MTNRKTRYRFYSPNSNHSFGFEGVDGGQTPTQKPQQGASSPADAPDDDLQNIDQSQGGYGGGSGFSPDRT